MKPAKYERQHHTIKELPKGKRKPILGGRDGKTPSANAAKRESRRLQMEADGGLGRGTVRLAK